MTMYCPVCASTQLSPLVYRENVPVHQNLVMDSAQSAKQCTTGIMDIQLCRDCGFVFNQKFDLSLLSYGDEYDNTQCHSNVFEDYMDDLVRELVEVNGVRNATVVEIGCGKGTFLKKLVNYPGANNKGIGFDPSYVGEPVSADGKLSFYKTFYDETCVDVDADVIICRHVIEHVPAPVELLKNVRLAIGERADTRVFFETPCIDWILENKVVWDFFYEHCALFSAGSLSCAFNRAGFQVEHVRHVFNEQYLWLSARPADQILTEKDAGKTTQLAEQYQVKETLLLHDLRELIVSCQRDGGVALWGAGAKGATLAHLLDPHVDLITAVVDVNPNKQEKFIPGSGHRIISPSTLDELQIQHVILMNPNYRHEVEKTLSTLTTRVTLHEWTAS